MSLIKLWKKENKARSSDRLRRERSIRNWPIHAELITDSFLFFAEYAKSDGESILVAGFPFRDDSARGLIGKFPIGSTNICLTLAFESTGEGLTEVTNEGRKSTIYLEYGASLIVHHSPNQGVVQVFFEAPRINDKELDKEPLLAYHTFNTDNLTKEWCERIIAKFLVFNRVESTRRDASLRDRAKVRLWKFLDIRNRRGYLDRLQHIFTPWELLFIATVIYVASATATFISG